MDDKFVGLFFYCGNRLELFTVPIEEAEKYGDFLIYPYSHYEIWEQHLRIKYRRDYAYYPRGRIMYNTKEKQFWIYSDKCIPMSEIGRLAHKLKKYRIKEDEHYMCNRCQ